MVTRGVTPAKRRRAPATIPTSASIETWEDFLGLLKLFRDQGDRWIFRGQRQDWPLESSLDRAVARIPPTRRNRPKAEAFLTREFRRHFHHYSTYKPRENDTLEWLSLMQHYGTPTRLLDWTFSAQVALYFAIESAMPGPKARCVLHAVNQVICWESFKNELSTGDRRQLERHDDKDIRIMNRVLRRFKGPFICPSNPYYLSERLTVQQGTFLVPLDLSCSFLENFVAWTSRHPEGYRKVTIECSQEFFERSLLELHQVNISDANLFPGLDGFARALRTRMLLKQVQPLI